MTITRTIPETHIQTQITKTNKTTYNTSHTTKQQHRTNTKKET